MHNAVCTTEWCKYTGTWLPGNTVVFCVMTPCCHLVGSYQVFQRKRVAMRALCTFETLAAIYQTKTWWHNPEDNMNLHIEKTSNLTHEMDTFSYLNRAIGEGKKNRMCTHAQNLSHSFLLHKNTFCIHNVAARTATCLHKARTIVPTGTPLPKTTHRWTRQPVCWHCGVISHLRIDYQ
jgi:hypothetical protein